MTSFSGPVAAADEAMLLISSVRFVAFEESRMMASREARIR